MKWHKHSEEGYVSDCGTYRIVQRWRRGKDWRLLREVPRYGDKPTCVWKQYRSCADAKNPTPGDLAWLDGEWVAACKHQSKVDDERRAAEGVKRRETTAAIVRQCRAADSKVYLPGVHKSWFDWAEKFTGTTAAAVYDASQQAKVYDALHGIYDLVPDSDAIERGVEEYARDQCSFLEETEHLKAEVVTGEAVYYSGSAVINLRQHENGEVSAKVFVGAKVYNVPMDGGDLTAKHAAEVVHRTDEQSGRYYRLHDDVETACEWDADDLVVIRDAIGGAVLTYREPQAA